MAKGKTICVYGAKGGIGKSTFVMNLAGIFSNLQKKVLILDLDLSNGAISCALNTDINKTIFNFSDDYNNNRFENIDDYITKYNDFISVLSAPKDPRQANKIEPKYLDILIDKCLYKYDFILMDTTHTLDEINVYALDKADNILFIINNDAIGLKNLKNILNIMQDNEFDNYKLILNNSIDPSRKYFSNYDIKSILGINIDYEISADFHYSKIDSLTLDGEIITLKFNKFKDYKIFELIANDLIGGSNE